jgi:hypothetical protein
MDFFFLIANSTLDQNLNKRVEKKYLASFWYLCILCLVVKPFYLQSAEVSSGDHWGDS